MGGMDWRRGGGGGGGGEGGEGGEGEEGGQGEGKKEEAILVRRVRRVLGHRHDGRKEGGKEDADEEEEEEGLSIDDCNS